MTKKKLRSVDLLLTKLTRAGKFHILFWFPLILLILIALLLMQQNRNMRIEDNQRAMQQSLQQSAALIASLPERQTLASLCFGTRSSEPDCA